MRSAVRSLASRRVLRRPNRSVLNSLGIILRAQESSSSFLSSFEPGGVVVVRGLGGVVVLGGLGGLVVLGGLGGSWLVEVVDVDSVVGAGLGVEVSVGDGDDSLELGGVGVAVVVVVLSGRSLPSSVEVALGSPELVEVGEVVVVVLGVSAPVEESPDPDEEEEEDEDTGGLEDGEGCGELVDEVEDAESDAEVDDDELESPDPSASRTLSINPLFEYA